MTLDHVRSLGTLSLWHRETASHLVSFLVIVWRDKCDQEETSDSNSAGFCQPTWA